MSPGTVTHSLSNVAAVTMQCQPTEGESCRSFTRLHQLDLPVNVPEKCSS